MKRDLFREKALKKMLSPEEINHYIKTSQLSMWLVFFAVSVLLIGVLFWAFFGELRLYFSAVTVCENGEAVCYISENHVDEISHSTCVQIEGRTYPLGNISEVPVPAAEHLSPYGLHLGNFEDGQWVYAAEIDSLSKDGLYRTDVLAKSISPIRLLLN